MTDEGHEGSYTWASDGTVAGEYIRKIGGVQFATGEPDNLEAVGGQHCAMLEYGQLNDIECSYEMGWCLCELEGIHLKKATFKLFLE